MAVAHSGWLISWRVRDRTGYLNSIRSETDLKVESVDTAIDRFIAAGGSAVSPATEIPIGKVAVVRDPFGNELVILDSSKGLLTTDERGNVTGVSSESNKDATI